MQKSGYLYKRAPQSNSWQQRFVTLSIDSGTMKFFAEKGGVRAAKGTVCIRQGQFSTLPELPGHPFAFEIRMEDMIGKSDEAIQTLSVDTQEQLNQWREWIEQTFKGERRGSAIMAGEQSSTTPTRTKSFLASLFPAVEGGGGEDPPQSGPSEPQASQAAVSSAQSSAATNPPPQPEPRESRSTQPEPALTSQPDEAEPAPDAEYMPLPSLKRPLKPLARRPSRYPVKGFVAASERDDGPELDMSEVYQQDGNVQFVDPNDTDSAAPSTTAPNTAGSYRNDSPTSARTAPAALEGNLGTALAEKLEAKLNARRQSFRPPNFKNLLNSNGFDSVARRGSGGVGGGSGVVSEANSDAEGPSVPSSTRSAPPLRSREVARAALNPSPLTEAVRLETPEPSPMSGDGLAPRRSFTKSPARRRTSKKAAHAHGAGEGIAQDDSSRSHTPSPAPGATEPHSSSAAPPARNTHPLTRHLKICVRPTDPVRMGNLFRLDTTNAQEAAGMGQDVWLSQFVSLDVTTGMMLVYSEVNGKRIQRAKFDINSCSIKSIDQLYHSRLHCFKVTYRPEDPNEKKVTAVFAAEDEDTLHYWLISFEDCEVHFLTHGAGAHLTATVPKKVPAATAAPPSAPAPVSAVPSAPASAREEHSAAPPKPPLPRGTDGGSESASAAPAATSEPGKITPADLMNALKKRNALKQATPSEESSPGIATPSTHAYEDDDDDGLLRVASMQPFAAPMQSKFASAPAVAVNKEEAYVRQQALLRQTDSPFGSSEALWTAGEPLHRIDTMNMDQMFAPTAPYKPPAADQSQPQTTAPTAGGGLGVTGAANASSSGLPATGPVSMRMQPTYDFTTVKFALKRLHFPAERLARRIKIWYFSSGFSLSTPAEVEQFVSDLRSTGDKVLADFAEEKFGELQDWANLLAVLRKYEQRRLIEAPRDPAMATPGITFEVASKVPGTPGVQDLELLFETSTTGADLCRQLAMHLGAPVREVQENLHKLLLGRDNNILGKGLGQLSEDLTFAEDILLYQEEVIDHVWADFVSQKALLEERDETITKLYARLSAMEEAQKRGPVTSISHPQVSNASWAEEKARLEQIHNDARAKLVTEIQTLRKVLSPAAEQQFNDLKRSEYLRAALEEEVVNTHMDKDNLKAELAALKDKMQEMENEKSAIEAHWQEQLRLQKDHYDAELYKMKVEVDKARETAQRVVEEASNARRLNLKPLLQAANNVSGGHQPLPSPMQAPTSSVPPTPDSFATSAVVSTGSSTSDVPVATESAKTITVVSRYASPKPTPNRVNKTYVNHYATFEDPSEQQQQSAALAKGATLTVKVDAPAAYSPYNYSTEIKEGSEPASSGYHQAPVQPHSVLPSPADGTLRRVASGNLSTGSLRRDELADPEDERDPSPPMRHLDTRGMGVSAGFAPVGHAQTGAGPAGGTAPAVMATPGGNWDTARNAVQASIRMMRLPGSGAASPMPPAGGIPFSATTPQVAPNALQVPRTQLKTSSIRAALRAEVQAKPTSASSRTPGAYMTPHSVPYQVMAASTEEGQRTRSVPPPSPSAVPQQGFMSATKATARQHQLVRESARETFAKTYTYQKKAF